MKYATTAFALALLAIGCDSRMNMQIEKLDFGDGDYAFGIALPITPYGEAYFVAPDTSDESKKLLQELHRAWDDLWPNILSSMKQAADGSDVDLIIDDDEFIGMVQYLDDDVYMGDKADIMIAIRPQANAVPEWHFFIRGSTIVHFQPVY